MEDDKLRGLKEEINEVIEFLERFRDCNGTMYAMGDELFDKSSFLTYVAVYLAKSAGIESERYINAVGILWDNLPISEIFPVPKETAKA